MRTGVLLVVCGPSGVGKGTLCKQLSNHEANLYPSVSVTTRSKRPDEQEGRHYYFVKEDVFMCMVAQEELLEHAKVYGNYYGTPSAPLHSALAEGKDVLLEIDVQGALQVKASFNDAVLVFILPPNMEELKRRIERRNTEGLEQIELRLKTATQEIASINKFDYVIINDSITESWRSLQAILYAERLRTARLLRRSEHFAYSTFHR